ncbi:hypothetical protein TNCV_1248571 [Trichonephila clavipes]|nr:hypothetical protein TNCV_1248571 [Trichonephila clavipes]
MTLVAASSKSEDLGLLFLRVDGTTTDQKVLRYKIRQAHLTQQTKSSDSLDATPPINSNSSHARHNEHLVRSPILRLTVGKYCSANYISQ